MVRFGRIRTVCTKYLRLTKNHIKDIFYLDKTEYAARVSGYSDEHLRRQEVVKLQQLAGSCCSCVSGVTASCLTCTNGIAFGIGTSLIAIYATRRCYKAKVKLKIIRSEVFNRGYALHEYGWPDFFIPCCAVWTGSCIAPCCVGGCLSAAAAAPVAAAASAAVLPVSDMLAHNSGPPVVQYVHSMLEGALAQVAQEALTIVTAGNLHGVTGLAAVIGEHITPPVTEAAVAGGHLMLVGQNLCASLGTTMVMDRLLNQSTMTEIAEAERPNMVVAEQEPCANVAAVDQHFRFGFTVFAVLLLLLLVCASFFVFKRLGFHRSSQHLQCGIHERRHVLNEDNFLCEGIFCAGKTFFSKTNFLVESGFFPRGNLLARADTLVPQGVLAVDENHVTLVQGNFSARSVLC